MSGSVTYKEGTLLEDDVEMTAMAIETVGEHPPTQGTDDSEPSCLPTSSISDIFCSSSDSNRNSSRRSSIADLVSFIGFRGVAVIIALKLAGIIVFAMFFVNYTSTSDLGDVSHVTLTKSRLENLREKIRQTTLSASSSQPTQKVLFTLPVATTYVYDRYIEVSRHQCIVISFSTIADVIIYLLLVYPVLPAGPFPALRKLLGKLQGQCFYTSHWFYYSRDRRHASGGQGDQRGPIVGS